uniref:X8 domain-containing protein n=1 Tax=Aegilops tauschii subsp. strangulata TaxID=200361 RepID=A0A453S6Q4_AEGTS
PMVAASPPSTSPSSSLQPTRLSEAPQGRSGCASGGQLWCVVKNNVEDGALQSAIGWACGPNGGADCRAIQQGGTCYEPPTSWCTPPMPSTTTSSDPAAPPALPPATSLAPPRSLASTLVSTDSSQILS